ncbi:MAG TPA: MarR family transcriptional regulator [Sphingobium sp.]
MDDQGPGIELTVEEIGFFYASLHSARDQLSGVTKMVAKEFSLGPRGPWMLSLIGKQPMFPHELAVFFRVGRSLITAELDRLAGAGLIISEKNAEDGRRVEITLTKAGQRVRQRVSEELAALLQSRLIGFSREEILHCSTILHAFSIVR